MNILTLYNKFYVILATYMLDSALEPSYYLSKNLLFLPWILKLIVDMVNDSTPLFSSAKIVYKRMKEKNIVGSQLGINVRKCIALIYIR